MIRDILQTPFVPAIATFALVVLIVPFARRLALKAGFVDNPGGRKVHDAPVPPIGGLVIFPAAIAVSVLCGIDIGIFWPLFAAIGILLVTGAVDDYRQINAWVKFSLQIVAATAIVILGNARLYQLGDLFGFGDVGLDFASVPFSIVATVLLINAINLMDGLDGLAAGKSFIVLLWFVLACLGVGETNAAFAIAPFMGALAGFLFYNMRHPLRDKACIFLGDAGSMALGLIIAWFSMGVAHEPNPILFPISVAWILALPIIDACGQFYRRVREGRHPFAPDRGHFHHHFIHAGFPVGQSTFLILTIGFLLGAVGYLGALAGVPQWILTAGWIALLFSHIALSSKPEIYIGIFRRFGDRTGFLQARR